MIEDFEEGSTQDVTMHDGSTVRLKKLEGDHDPTNRMAAVQVIEEANANEQLLTGLIYVDPSRPSLTDMLNIPETPINRLPIKDMRPAKETLAKINEAMF